MAGDFFGQAIFRSIAKKDRSCSTWAVSDFWLNVCSSCAMHRQDDEAKTHNARQKAELTQKQKRNAFYLLLTEHKYWDSQLKYLNLELTRENRNK